MTGIQGEAELGSWRVAGCLLQVEYALPVLDQIRGVAVDAFFAVPRGGAETGGILFGTRQGSAVRILAFQPMECEHAFGPTFVLSEKDKARLEEQLSVSRNDPALRGLEVVGWFHSHTRSEIFLSDLDLEIYRQFFPQPWQVALVLRPAGMKPTRAGFFFREADGAVHSAASYREFIIGARGAISPIADADSRNGRPPAALPADATAARRLRSVAPPPAAAESRPPVAGIEARVAETTPPVEAKPEAAPPPAEPVAAAPVRPAPAAGVAREDFVSPAFPSQPEAGPVVMPVPPGEGPADAADVAADRPAPAGGIAREELVPPAFPSRPEAHPRIIPVPPAERSAAAHAAAAAHPVPADVAREEFVPPAFLSRPEAQPSHRWIWVSLLLLLLLGGGAAAYYTSEDWMPLLVRKTVNLHLQALDQGGQLRIEWDKEALATLDLAGGTLEIVDGQARTSVPLDALKIRTGSFQYQRQSEMVEVHLSVRTAAGSTMEEFTSFIGQAPPRPAGAQDSQREAEAADAAAAAEKARADLKKQELRTLELEQSLQRMRDALQREQERKRGENQPPLTASSTPAVDPRAAGSASPVRSTPPAPAPADATAPSAAARTPSPASSLSGRWTYSPASRSGSPFPPESVNLVMTEANGHVRGVFSGRYRVPKGRKFAANVRFNFQGPVHPSSSKFSFAGADGMKGSIEVIRLPGKQDALEVVWYPVDGKLTFDDIFFRVP